MQGPNTCAAGAHGIWEARKLVRGVRIGTSQTKETLGLRPNPCQPNERFKPFNLDGRIWRVTTHEFHERTRPRNTIFTEIWLSPLRRRIKRISVPRGNPTTRHDRERNQIQSWTPRLTSQELNHGHELLTNYSPKNEWLRIRQEYDPPSSDSIKHEVNFTLKLIIRSKSNADAEFTTKVLAHKIGRTYPIRCKLQVIPLWFSSFFYVAFVLQFCCAFVIADSLWIIVVVCVLRDEEYLRMKMLKCCSSFFYASHFDFSLLWIPLFNFLFEVLIFSPFPIMLSTSSI